MCQNRLWIHLFVAEKEELSNKTKEKFDIFFGIIVFTLQLAQKRLYPETI